jgi:hypothetical protein
VGRRINNILIPVLVLVGCSLIFGSCDQTDLGLFIEALVDTAEEDIPPMVSYVTPEDGEIGVGLRPKIIIDFNKSMDPDTINATTIILSEGSTLITVQFTMSEDLYTTTLTLESDLELLTEYVLTISADVADVYGNTLGSDYVTSFRTRG